jgi:hypothetical protein
MRFFEHEPDRFVLLGGLQSHHLYAAYLVLLPLIGYAIAYSVTYAGGISFRLLPEGATRFRRPLQ